MSFLQLCSTDVPDPAPDHHPLALLFPLAEPWLVGTRQHGIVWEPTGASSAR